MVIRPLRQIPLTGSGSSSSSYNSGSRHSGASNCVSSRPLHWGGVSAQAHVLREHMMQLEPHGEQMQPQQQQQVEGECRLQQHLSNEHLQQRHQHYYPRALAAPSGYLLGADAAPAMNITCLV